MALPTFSRTPHFQADGRRVLNRSGHPSWMTLDEAQLLGFRLMAELVRSDDPGLILPRINELAWAIFDARSADTAIQNKEAA